MAMLELRLMDEEQIRLLYDQSLSRDFPPSELKSLSAILHMHRRREYDVLGVYESNAFVGYALVYCPRNQRLALLDYFAVEPAYRRQGLGGTILKLLRMHYGNSTDALLIECERPKSAPDEMEARKRIQFYTQAGAVLTRVRIWLFGVEYSILVLPCAQEIPDCDWAGQMMLMYKQMLPDELFRANVRLLRS